MEIDIVAGPRVRTLKVGRELTSQLGTAGQVHEPQLGTTGQSHGEIVGHDSLIPSCYEDGGGVDL
jgi:hypothetical protein